MHMKTRGIVGPVLGVELDGDAVRGELERVLRSPGFTRNERLSQFLRFIVERHIEGRDEELKESVIGSEVFGRKPDYNPKDDPIVRTEARRLRDRLEKYYERSGPVDALLIEIPKGGYVPFVRRVSKVVEPEVPAPALTEIVDLKEDGLRVSKWRWVALAFVGLAIAFVAVGWPRFQMPDPLREKTNGEAYDLYLRARGFEAMPSVTGIESSIRLFRRAIEKDPSFAPAHAGVGAGCAARSAFDGFDTSQRVKMIADGWEAAEKAFQLDPLLADVHDALGMMQARDAQWVAAERSFRRAVELAPRDILWREHFAMFLLLPLGRVEEAVEQLQIAEEVDPLSPAIHMALSGALTVLGRHDEALFHCNKGAWNDQRRSSCWAQILLSQGRNEEAIRTLEPTWTGHMMEPGAQVLGIAYASAGRRKDAERIAAMVPRLASKTQIVAALGDKDRTFEMLHTMVPMGPTRMGRDFLTTPRFAFLKGDPRLKAIRKNVGLPE
jgi:tetratricopeptide (TPR) repeat protein